MNKFLLAGDNSMPEKRFTHSACGPFTKNKERLEKFMQTGITDYGYKNDLIKLVFNIIWLKELNNRTQSYKVLRDKAFEIASNQKYGGYQKGLASMVHKFFIEM